MSIFFNFCRCTTQSFLFFLQPWPLPHSPLLTLLLHQSSYPRQWPPVLGRCREKALASPLTITFFPTAYQTTTKSPLILYPKCYRPVCCLLLYCLLPNPKSQNRSLIRFFWINLYMTECNGLVSFLPVMLMLSFLIHIILCISYQSFHFERLAFILFISLLLPVFKFIENLFLSRYPASNSYSEHKILNICWNKVN